jgi:CheY-like chemotaxis protein
MPYGEKTILCVDDDEDDIDLLSYAIKEINPTINIAVAKNGLEALDYLHSITDLPCLIVLDLNMPYLDGKETFKRIKAHSPFQNIPIVIFTSSANPADKAMFNNLGIDFLTKPPSFSGISNFAEQIISRC